VLGYGFVKQPQTLLQTRRPTLKILSKDGTVLEESAKMETPDTIFLHGTLKSEVPISMTFRTGAPFPGTPGLDWRIAGEEGEIRITASGPFLQIGYDDAKVEVVRDGKVESFKMGEFGEDEIDGVPFGNVSRVYRQLREGRVNCSFEEAVELHKVLEEAWKANGYPV
jgi:predicted dehydrogenase